MSVFNSGNLQYTQPPPQYGAQYGYSFTPKNPWNKHIRRSSNLIFIGLFLSTLLAIVEAPLFRALEGYIVAVFNLRSPGALSTLEIAIDSLVYSISFIIPLLLIRLWIGIPARYAFPMKKVPAAIAIPAVFLCLGVSVAGLTTTGMLYTFCEQVLGFVPHMPDLPKPVGGVATIVYVVQISVLPAFIEELFFRGVVMQSLRRFGDVFAVFASALVFAIAHQNALQFLNTFLVGIAIGFFVIRTSSLWIGILIHFVNNLFATGLELLSFVYGEQIVSYISLGMMMFYFFVGIIGLIIFTSRYDNIFSLRKSNYPLPESKKFALFFSSPSGIGYIALSIFASLMLFGRA